MFFKTIDLFVNYQGVSVLKGVTLEAMENSVIALIGANGAGKSTFLRSVSGLKKIAAGYIMFQGERIDSFPPNDIVRLGIAHVPEGRRVFPRMTVFENIIIGSHLRRDRNQITHDLDTIFEHFPILKERKSQLSGKLSGGEQQMLAIARALMAKPKLILLDEPSLGLAPLMLRHIAKIIIDIRTLRQATVILVEQNARMALKISDTGYVLESGKVATRGRSIELLEDDHVRKAYFGG